MAVPFGFSAGDFIAALKIVKDVTDALRDSGGAGEEYRELVNELYTLETALLEVKRVELDDEQHAQRVALQQAASQCHRTIDEFWKKIQKYQPHLRSEGSGSRVKDGWRKIQWALCKKEDVANFRAKLRGHTGSINVLLMTVQMNSTAINRKRNDRSRQTLEAQLQQNTFAHLGMLQDIANGVNGSVQQGEELLLSTATVLRTNVQIFQLVLGLQNHVLSLPSQVERQQPVTFFDACGRVYPFHLEFINSAEAFHAVLRVRFKDVGLVKIDRREYFIKETATGREIDLSRPWDQCFLPGQEADMSMIFHAAEGDTCPGCKRYCGDACTAEVVCSNCGMTVRRITDIEKEEREPTTSSASALDDTMKDISGGGLPKAAGKRERSINDDEEVARFRRVRIVTKLQAKALHFHGFPEGVVFENRAEWYAKAYDGVDSRSSFSLLNSSRTDCCSELAPGKDTSRFPLSPSTLMADELTSSTTLASSLSTQHSLAIADFSISCSDTLRDNSRLSSCSSSGLQSPLNCSPSVIKSNEWTPKPVFVCLEPYCPSCFSREADLIRHRDTAHGRLKRWECPKPRCERKGDYGFSRKDHLYEHLRSTHGLALRRI